MHLNREMVDCYKVTSTFRVFWHVFLIYPHNDGNILACLFDFILQKNAQNIWHFWGTCGGFCGLSTQCLTAHRFKISVSSENHPWIKRFSHWIDILLYDFGFTHSHYSVSIFILIRLSYFHFAVVCMKSTCYLLKSTRSVSHIHWTEPTGVLNDSCRINSMIIIESFSLRKLNTICCVMLQDFLNESHIQRPSVFIKDATLLWKDVNNIHRMRTVQTPSVSQLMMMTVHKIILFWMMLIWQKFKYWIFLF